MKFDIKHFFEKCENPSFIKSNKHDGYSKWGALGVFFIIFCPFLLIMRNVSDKSCRGNPNTHFMFDNFFQKSCCLWDNVEKCCTAVQATDDSMAHVHCILDAWGYKYTHSGCIILNAFPQQQWLHEHASVLRYTYIACLISFSKDI
jgi:hypothetical protein